MFSSQPYNNAGLLFPSNANDDDDDHSNNDN